MMSDGEAITVLFIYFMMFVAVYHSIGVSIGALFKFLVNKYRS